MTPEGLVRDLVERFPELEPILLAHRQAHQEAVDAERFLPEIFPFLVAKDNERDMYGNYWPARRRVWDVVGYLEEAFARGDQELRDIISSGFVAAAPGYYEPGSSLIDVFGPFLMGELRRQRGPRDPELEAFINRFVDRCPILRPLLDEHLADYSGEILSTLFLANVARWCTAVYLKGPEAPEYPDLLCVLAELERDLVEGDDDVQTVISTGFLEMLPSPGEEGAGIVERLGPESRSEVAGFPWSAAPGS